MAPLRVDRRATFAGFDRDERWKVLGAGIGVAGLDEVFDNESTAAHAADEFFPGVEEFERAAFAVGEIAVDYGKRSFAFVWFGDEVTSAARYGCALEGGGLLVLADVLAAGNEDTRDFGVDLADVAHVTSAHGLDDRIESGFGEHREMVHRGFDGAELNAEFRRELLVEGEHFGAEVDDGDEGTGFSEERAVFPAAGGEAKDAFAGDGPLDPAEGISSGERIAHVAASRGFGVRGTLAGALIPNSAIVYVKVVHCPI